MVGDGLSFDPFAFCQNGWTASTVDVCWGKIVDALVVAAVVIVVDKGRNLSFEIAGDVAGTVVGQEPWALYGFGLVQPTGLRRQVECALPRLLVGRVAVD